jgi:molybdopterin synthase catalytic subunit
MVINLKIKITKELDSLDKLINEIKNVSKDIGAVAIFIGSVRESKGDEKVIRLEYESHEVYAKNIIKNIIHESRAKYNIIDAIVEHRIGKVKVSEDVLYVLVASVHRKEGFNALSDIVERIKYEVPIWKKEVTGQQTYWIENG